MPLPEMGYSGKGMIFCMKICYENHSSKGGTGKGIVDNENGSKRIERVKSSTFSRWTAIFFKWGLGLFSMGFGEDSKGCAGIIWKWAG